MQLAPPEPRALPASWHTALADIAPPYRAAACSYAWRCADAVAPARFTGRAPLEREIAPESTGLSPLLYAACVPFHLVAPGEENRAAALLAESGPGALLAALNADHPGAATVLVLGDQPADAQLAAQLDRLLAARSVRTLVAGPGPALEAALRSHASTRGIPRYHVQALDHSNGACWGMPAGAALDALIARLFHEKRPHMVLALEPTRLPATLIALEQARLRGLPVDYVSAAPRAAPHEPAAGAAPALRPAAP